MTDVAVGGDQFRSVLIHSSMRGDASGARARGIHAGELNPSWHYRSFHQAHLWLQVHQAHAPQGDTGVLGIYSEAAAATAATAARRLDVVAVASGGGEKEALVVAALVDHGYAVHYFPVDISVELALRSAETADQAGLVCTPIAGDISAMPDFPGWLEAHRDSSAGVDVAQAESDSTVATVVTAFGITPNMHPQVLFPWLRGLLGSHGELLISANLFTSWPEILPQYDNPETAEWLRQLLVDWGIASLLSPVRFTAEDVDGIPAVIASADWLADRSWQFDGEEIDVRAGDRLQIFFSLRFTPELFAATCESHGLVVVEEFIDELAGEGVWRVRALLPAEGAGGHNRADDGPADE